LQQNLNSFFCRNSKRSYKNGSRSRSHDQKSAEAGGDDEIGENRHQANGNEEEKETNSAEIETEPQRQDNDSPIKNQSPTDKREISQNDIQNEMEIEKTEISSVDVSEVNE